MKRKEIILLFFQLLMLIVFILFTLLNENIDLYKKVLIIVFIEVFIISFKEGFLNIYQTLLITIFFFNIGRVFIDVFFKVNMNMRTLYLDGILKDNTVLTVLQIYNLFLLLSSIAFLLLDDKREKVYRKNLKNHKYLKYIFYILLFLSFLKVLKIIQFVYLYGYLSLFNGDISSLNFLRGITIICEALFVVLIYNSNSKKEFLYYTMNMLFFVYAPKILTGQRGPTILFILFMIYFYNSRYGIKNKKKIILLGIILLPIMQMIVLFRDEKIIVLTKLFNLETFVGVVYQQSVSILIPAYIIDFKEKLIFNNKFPYFLSYFIDIFKGLGNGQNMKKIIYGNYLGDQLTYFISPTLYLSGGGTGTSIIAELIDLSKLNYILFSIYSFIYVYLSIFINKIKELNILLFTISYFYIQSFIYSPRDSIGKAVSNILYHSFFIALFYIFNRFLIKKNSIKGDMDEKVNNNKHIL